MVPYLFSLYVSAGLRLERELAASRQAIAVLRQELGDAQTAFAQFIAVCSS